MILRFGAWAGLAASALTCSTAALLPTPVIEPGTHLPHLPWLSFLHVPKRVKKPHVASAGVPAACFSYAVTALTCWFWDLPQGPAGVVAVSAAFAAAAASAACLVASSVAAFLDNSEILAGGGF